MSTEDTELHEPQESNCSAESGRADLLRHAALIIIDEVPMAGRKVIQCIDRLLRDLKPQHKGSRFASTYVIMSGDFSQTSPIVPNGDRVAECYMWLTNMNWWAYSDEGGDIHYHTLTTALRQTDAEYDEFILRVAAGSAPLDDPADQRLNAGDSILRQGFGRACRAIALPQDLFQHTTDLAQALSHAHPDLLDSKACSQSAVLCPRNATVDQINALALHLKSQQDGLPVTCLRGKTSVKTMAGAPMLDNAGDDFLQACDGKGMLHIPSLHYHPPVTA